MQIIIVQSEIEEAIRNHILNQITVNENMEISIDLRATRGDTGFQATIDIVNKGATSTSQTANEQAPAQQAEPTATRRGRPPKAQEEASAETTKVEPTAEDTSTVGDTPAKEEPASEDTPAKPLATGKSLFGNLKKPDNSKAAETETETEAAAS